MSVAEIIKSIRKNNQLTQEEFTDGINAVFADPRDRVVSMTVSNWENGKFIPVLTKVDYLATHAPVGSWVREFGERGVEIIREVISDVAA